MCEISLESQMLSSVAIFLPKQDLHIGAVSFKERRQGNRFRGLGVGGTEKDSLKILYLKCWLLIEEVDSEEDDPNVSGQRDNVPEDQITNEVATKFRSRPP